MDMKHTVTTSKSENNQPSSKENRLTPEEFQRIMDIEERLARRFFEVEEGTSPGMERIKKGMDEYKRKHPEKY